MRRVPQRLLELIRPLLSRTVLTFGGAAFAGVVLGKLTVKFSWKTPLLLTGAFIAVLLIFIPELYLLLYLVIDQTPFLGLRMEVFAALFGSWLLYVFVNKIKIAVTPLEWMLIAFACVMALATLITGPFKQAINYLNLIVVCFVISTVIDSPARLKRLVFGFILWGLYVTFGGLLQVFFQTSLFSTSFAPSTGESGVVVATGTYGDPVIFARTVQFAMILCFYRLMSVVSRRKKVLFSAILLVLTVGWLSSGNRTTMLSLAAVLVAMVVVDRKISFRLIAAVSGAGVLAMILLPRAILPAILSRAQSVVPTVFGLGTVHQDIRITFMLSGLHYLVDNPGRFFIGVGASNYPVYVLPYLPQPIVMGAIGGGYTTSSIILVLVESGILGLGLLLLATLWAFLVIVKLRRFYQDRNDRDMLMIATGIMMLQVAMIVQLLLNNVIITYLFWLSLGLTAALKRISLKEQQA